MNKLSIILCAFIISGCAHYFGVNSVPQGADIYFNNTDTGKKTPANFYIKDMETGDYNITLKKEGYKTAHNVRTIRIQTSWFRIINSILGFPIITIAELIDPQWKGIYANKDDGTFKSPPFRIKPKLEPITQQAKTE